jgi:HEAT repeat protein
LILRARAAAPLRARLLECDLSLVRDIAKALHRLDDPRAVGLAIAALNEEPYTRRLAAARVLGALSDPRGGEPLRKTLQDEIAGVRVAALEALAQIGGSSELASDCARLLADPNAHVRIAAVRAVARTTSQPGTMLAEVVRDQDRLVRLEVARHVAGLPADAARALLFDPDLRVREAAAKAAGTQQVGALAVLLVDDPSRDVRHAAAQALGSLGDQRIPDVLAPGLEDPDPIVRAAVLRALGRLLTRTGVVDWLCQELKSDRAERRRASVYALVYLDAREAAESVSRLLANPAPDVRLVLTHAADSVLSDPQPLMQRLATDPDPDVRNSAELWILRRSDLRE